HPAAVSSGSNSMDVSGTIAITTQPAEAGELLTVGGANRTIEWSDVGLTNFDVVYKIGSGSENAVTGCSNIAANSCTFALADAMVGKNLTVIVKDADTTNHPQVLSPPVSNAFNVKGALTITTQPVAGNNTPKVVGDSVSMNWSSNATTVDSYHLYYVIAGVETYVNYNGNGTPILAAQLPISFNLLSEMVGTGVSLKVYDANADHPTTATALSNSMDISGTISITSQPVPADDTAKSVGDSMSIGWSTVGNITQFDLFYSVDGGAEVKINASPIITSPYTFPTGILAEMIGNNVRLKVKDANLSNPVTASAASNSMDVSGTIAIMTQPANANETLTIGGADRTIEWSDVGITNFDVFYKIGSGSESAVTGCSNIAANSCTFALINAMVGKNLTVIVKDADTTNHPQVLSPLVSNVFNVKGAITITTQPAPANNTPKVVGNSVSMNWSSNAAAVNSYNLYYVIGGAETYINYNGDGTPILAAQLPINFNLLSEMVGIGVSLKAYDANADHPVTASALSNSMDIGGTIPITSQPVPADDTAKSAGEAISIAWSGPSGIVGYDVYYSIDGGADTLIDACNDVPAATSSCAFNILPAMVGNNVRLKVKDYDPAHPITVSAASNSMDVSGTIAITTQPAGADEILTIGGANRMIEWSDVGLTNFDVVYKIGAGSENAVTGCSNIAANSCTFTLVSDMVGKNLTVIVRDADTTNHPQVLSPPVSNAFNVRGALTITTQPVAGNNTPKVVGDSISMNWSSNAAAVTSYHLYYVIGGAETYIDYKGGGAAITAADLPISFNLLPEMTGTGVSLKAYDANADHPVTATALSNSMDISGTLGITSLTVNGEAVTSGQTFIVGNTVVVGWNPSGITQFNVLYSIDGGADQSVNSTPIEGTNSHTFTAPASMIGKNIVLKVKDGNVNHPIVVSSPSNAFDMKGTIAITTQPVVNAGTTLSVNDPVSIEWAYTGDIASFDVFYSINGGADQKLNTDAISGTSYNFNVPETMLGRNIILKVKDANTTGHPDTESSASTLFHVKGTITISSFTIDGQNVTSGQTFDSGDPVSISWDVSGNITDIDVFYKIGAGDDVKINSSPIVAPTTNYNFNALPGMVGKNVILKVKDADLINHAPNEVSSNSFDMKGVLAFTTSPTGVITIDDEVPIAWSKNGNMPEVHLYYTVDGADTLIASNLDVSSVDWTVPPEAIGSSVTLKVKDANLSHPASSVVSTPFGVKGKLVVTKPDGFTAYEVNDTPLIEWTKSSTINAVDLYYSVNGTDWTLITDTGPVTGTTYDTWNIPGAALGPEVYIKAKDADSEHPLTEAISADFPVRGRLVLNEPGANPNTFFEVNGETEITWTRFGTTGPMAGGVTLWYTTNGGTDGYPYEITCQEGARLASDELCTWTIPDSISNDVKVKIILTGDTATNDVSTNPFAIRGKLTILSPNGDPDGEGPLLAEDWEVQSPHVITWDKDGTTGAMSGNVELRYSVNNGADGYPYLIATALTNGANDGCTPPEGGGCYPWNVSDAVSNQMRVKIILLNDSNVADVSNNPFTTRAAFTVTSPGAEVWKVSLFKTIQWQKRGSVSNVKIEYSTNSFANETQTVEISPSANNGSNTVAGNGADGDCTALAGEGCYVWKVADAAVSETAMIRVSDANDSVSKDESVEFKIRPIITVVTPNSGNEIWPVGSEQTISWTTFGNLANVKLEYSTNGFADEGQNNTIGTVVNLGATGDCTRPTGGGCYVWTIPNSISPPATKNIKVRVSDPNVSGTNDLSNDNFRIVGGFTITAPNGTPSAESWPVDSIQTITWNKAGSVSNVMLSYTKNGTDWIDIDTNAVNGSNTENGGCTAPEGQGCYKWEIPDDISPTAKIRVMDVN
ncbi:MAG: hypothetical protein WC551_13750, partial [Patescibacteria group bacterium]